MLSRQSSEQCFLPYLFSITLWCGEVTTLLLLCSLARMIGQEHNKEGWKKQKPQHGPSVDVTMKTGGWKHTVTTTHRWRDMGCPPPTSGLLFVGWPLPQFSDEAAPHCQDREKWLQTETPPHSFPVFQPGLPSFHPLSSSFCNHSWFPFFEAIAFQEVDLFSSNIIKLAALVLVVVSTPPEQLQPAPSLSKLEERIVFPNFLQKASLVHVGFCKGYFHGLKLPLQLWHFL